MEIGRNTVVSSDRSVFVAISICCSCTVSLLKTGTSTELNQNGDAHISSERRPSAKMVATENYFQSHLDVVRTKWRRESGGPHRYVTYCGLLTDTEVCFTIYFSVWISQFIIRTRPRVWTEPTVASKRLFCRPDGVRTDLPRGSHTVQIYYVFTLVRYIYENVWHNHFKLH